LATDDALLKAILAAHAGWSGGVGERFPVDSEPGTVFAELGTGKNDKEQDVRGTVPGVPGVPIENSIGRSATASPETNALADGWATWAERAAIREYDGAMSRAEAEVLTALELGPCPREPG
jgi:hypothetical protein